MDNSMDLVFEDIEGQEPLLVTQLADLRQFFLWWLNNIPIDYDIDDSLLHGRKITNGLEKGLRWISSPAPIRWFILKFLDLNGGSQESSKTRHINSSDTLSA